jgi:hypothetical protein
MAAKSTPIKVAGGKFGGCALKAVGLIAGGLSHVPQSELRVERFTLTVRQKSAAGVVVAPATKAQTEGSGEGSGANGHNSSNVAIRRQSNCLAFTRRALHSRSRAQLGL